MKENTPESGKYSDLNTQENVQGQWTGRRIRSQTEKDLHFYLDILKEEVDNIEFQEVWTIYHSVKDSYKE